MSWPLSSEKKVYFRLQGTHGDLFWYAIEKNSKDEVLAPAFDLPPVKYYITGFACWKSFIYVLGGTVYDPNIYPSFRGVTDVFYIDTRRPQDGWTKGPDLKQPRGTPYGLVVDDKMYALGGWRDLDSHTYGEFLQLQPDGGGCCWLPMEDSKAKGGPCDIVAHAVVSTAGGCWYDLNNNNNKVVVVHTTGAKHRLFVCEERDGGLYRYTFHYHQKSEEEEEEKKKKKKKPSSWKKMMETNMGKWECQGASVDEMMYFVQGKKFKGYDLIENKWYDVVGLEMMPGVLPSYRQDYSSLVHMGNGTLCLLWSYLKMPIPMTEFYTIVHCTKFTVHKVRGDATVAANIISFQRFKILKKGYLIGSVVIDDDESDPCKEKEDQSAKDSGKIPKEEEEEENSNDKKKKKKKKKKKNNNNNKY